MIKILKESTIQKGEELYISWIDPDWDGPYCYALVEYIGRTRDGKYKFKSTTYGWMFTVDLKNNTVQNHRGEIYEIDDTENWVRRLPTTRTVRESSSDRIYVVVNIEPRKSNKANLIPVQVKDEISRITFYGFGPNGFLSEYSTGSIKYVAKSLSDAEEFISRHKGKTVADIADIKPELDLPPVKPYEPRRRGVSESIKGSSVDWNDLNGSEQMAVEYALDDIKYCGTDLEDAVNYAYYRVDDANEESGIDEEADYKKILSYVRSKVQ